MAINVAREREGSKVLVGRCRSMASSIFISLLARPSMQDRVALVGLTASVRHVSEAPERPCEAFILEELLRI